MVASFQVRRLLQHLVNSVPPLEHLLHVWHPPQPQIFSVSSLLSKDWRYGTSTTTSLFLPHFFKPSPSACSTHLWNFPRLIATAISLGWKSQTLPLLLMVHWPTPTIAISAHCSREEARAEQAGPQTFLSCNTLKVLAAQLVKNDQSKALINWLVNYPVWMHTQKTTEFHWSHYSINTIAIQPSSNWAKS